MPSERFMQHYYGANGFVAKQVDEDAKIISEVAPVIRQIYGDLAEFGHYRIAIEAYKPGQASVAEAK